MSIEETIEVEEEELKGVEEQAIPGFSLSIAVSPRFQRAGRPLKIHGTHKLLGFPAPTRVVISVKGPESFETKIFTDPLGNYSYTRKFRRRGWYWVQAYTEPPTARSRRIWFLIY